MFSIIGILIVFGAVLGGFLLEKGPVAVLIQPSEFLIIGGAALGTLLSANPMHVLKKIANGIVQVLTGSKFSKKRYIETLKMMFALFVKGRKEGLAVKLGSCLIQFKSRDMDRCSGLRVGCSSIDGKFSCGPLIAEFG
jgi:flagellar motor component MotA